MTDWNFFKILKLVLPIWLAALFLFFLVSIRNQNEDEEAPSDYLERVENLSNDSINKNNH